MDGIRIIKLPECKMATSDDKELDEFDKWWSNEDKKRQDKFFPRDFMMFDEGNGKLIWFYALSNKIDPHCGFEIVDFPGGLYAVAISIDKDDDDGQRVYNEIKKWIQTNHIFELDERPGHYTMFHVITPDEVFNAMGYRQLDIFVPIKVLQT